MLPGSLWSFYYSLLRSLDALRPNFLHTWHAERRKDEGGEKRSSFDIEWVTEIIVAIVTFQNPGNPTGEFLHRCLQEVNSHTAMAYIAERKEIFVKRLGKISGDISLMSSMTDFVRADWPMFADFLTDTEVCKLTIARRGCISVETLRRERAFMQKKVIEFADDENAPIHQQYEAFLKHEGSLVYAYEQILSLFADHTVHEEDFDNMFFNYDIPNGDSVKFAKLREESNLFAERSGKRNIWKFNRTKRLMEVCINFDQSIDLIARYELFLFETSMGGVLHWSFRKVRSIMNHFNKRTNDLSNWEKTTVEKPEQEKQAVDGDERDDAMNAQFDFDEEEEMPKVPLKKRKRSSTDKVHVWIIKDHRETTTFKLQNFVRSDRTIEKKTISNVVISVGIILTIHA